MNKKLNSLRWHCVKVLVQHRDYPDDEMEIFLKMGFATDELRYVWQSRIEDVHVVPRMITE